MLSIKINKKGILKKIITSLEKKLTDLQDSINETQQSVRDAPSYLETWSDTTKFQLRGVKSNLEAYYSRLETSLKEIKEIDSSKSFENIEIGALVKISSNEKEALYFIAPSNINAETFRVNNQEITSLSSESRLGQLLLGKKVGETIKFRDSNLRIIEIS